MPSALFAILCLLWLGMLLTVPGGFTALAALRRGRLGEEQDRLEFLFLAFLGSFSIFALCALAAAQLGVFSIHLTGAVLLLYSLLVLLLLRPAPVRLAAFASARPIPIGEKLPPLILLLVLILAGIFYFRPTEYIFGGWDPGVYAGTGAHIARTGKIVIEDRTPEFLTPRERNLFTQQHSAGYPEKYPGFRRSGPQGSRLIPQFYHLYPVLLAAANFPAGLAGGFYLTPLLGIFALLSIYLLVRELWGKIEALIAVSAIAVNQVQVWQARLPTAEMLSQFLLFAGLFLLSRYFSRKEIYPARLAGVMLGLFLLSHISALAILPALGVFFYCRWFLGFRRGDGNFLIPFLLLALYSLLPLLLYGGEYAVLSLGEFFTLRMEWVWPAAILLAALIVLRLAGRGFRRRLVESLPDPPLRWPAVGLLLGLAFYGYFLRPLAPGLSADRTNLVELGWFLTRPGLALALAGACLLLLRTRRPAVWLFLLITIFFSLLFLWRQLISPYYMWAARRFAVVIVPGLLICAAWFLGYLARSRRLFLRWAGWLLFGLLIGLEIGQSRNILDHREYRSAVDFLDRLAGRVADGDLVAVSAAVDKLPAPLHLAYGLPVLPIYPEGEGRWKTVVELTRELVSRPDGPVIYLLAEEEPPPLPGIDLSLRGELLYHVPLLERSGVRIPSRLDYRAPDGRIMVKIFRLTGKDD